MENAVDAHGTLFSCKDCKLTELRQVQQTKGCSKHPDLSQCKVVVLGDGAVGTDLP